MQLKETKKFPFKSEESMFNQIKIIQQSLDFHLPMPKSQLLDSLSRNTRKQFDLNTILKANQQALEQLFLQILEIVYNTIENKLQMIVQNKSIQSAFPFIEKNLISIYPISLSGNNFNSKYNQHKNFSVIQQANRLTDFLRSYVWKQYQMSQTQTIKFQGALQNFMKRILSYNVQPPSSESDENHSENQQSNLEQLLQSTILEHQIYQSSLISKINQKTITPQQRSQVQQQVKNNIKKPQKNFIYKIACQLPPQRQKSKTTKNITDQLNAKSKVSNSISSSMKVFQYLNVSSYFSRHGINFLRMKKLTIKMLSKIQNFDLILQQVLSKQSFRILQKSICQASKLRQNVKNFKTYKIFNEIKELNKKLENIKIKQNLSEDQKDQELITIVSLCYCTFQNKYDPIRRRFIKNVLNFFIDQANIETNLHSILRLLQNKKQNNAPKNIFLQTIRKGSLLQISDLVVQQIQKINQQVKVPLNQRLDILRISKQGISSRVINFIISGFLSEDLDKHAQFRDLVQMMSESQIYSIRWASKSVSNLFDWFINIGKNLIGQCSSHRPYLHAGSTINKMREHLRNNPFNLAFEIAVLTGRYLADIFVRNFEGHQINIVSFSLGAQVVKWMLKRLVELNKVNILNQIVILGGVTDLNEFNQLLSATQYPLKIINFHSKHDSVLKYLLRRDKPGINPIGLKKIQTFDKLQQSHVIINENCSSYIWSHLLYRERLSLIGEAVQAMND